MSDPNQLSRDATVLDLDASVWEQIFAVNVTGAAFMSKYAVPHMRAAGGGSIVMTSSVIARTGMLRGIASAASKAALESLAKHIACAVGPDGIRCNSLALGPIASETYVRNFPAPVRRIIECNVPMRRAGTMREVAASMVFLASDESSYVNGEVITVDGGTMGHMPFDAQLAELFTTSQWSDDRCAATSSSPPTVWLCAGGCTCLTGAWARQHLASFSPTASHR